MHLPVGSSAKWMEVLRQVGLVGPTDATVLIRGETGTGKEILAREIHRASPRRDRSFVAVNLASLPPDLAASELFGHEKGAFTGATQERAGRIERADKGTLFLDEIGDLSPDIQVELLRFLQERTFERLGGTRTLRANVRVIAATNRNLERLRAEGKFRDDLFYRLNVFPLVAPPLRDRPEDIPVLVEYFVAHYSRKIGKTYRHIDRQALLRAMEYPWPGNVRELENLVERSVILCPEPVFTMNPQAQAEVSSPGGATSSLNAVIRAHIIRALKLCGGRIYGPDGAARLLGLKPSTLQAKLKRLSIDRGKV